MEEEGKYITNVEKLLGLTVDILLDNKTKLSGNIFTLNQKSKMIILINKNNENNKCNISFINMLQIKKIELSKTQVDIKANELLQIDLNYIKEKERINLENDNIIKRMETEPNFKKGFDLFKTLSKFYNCSYEGNKIILEGKNCYIEEPFRPQNIHCNDNKIKKQLESLIF